MLKELEGQLFFSREAADYLGISIQRLNQLVQNKKLKPIKRSKSSMVFHLQDLNARKKELDIFENPPSKKGGREMFRIDDQTKQEAANLSTLMKITGFTETKAVLLFESVGNEIPLYAPLEDQDILAVYARYADVDASLIKREYEKVKAAFSTLRHDDQIIKRGSPDYPKLLAETAEAPRFLYARGNISLLSEKRTVSLVGSRNATKESQDKAYRLANFLGAHGIVIISGLARGIDVNAHRGSLDNGYNTIAIIGTSLNQYYPRENKNVQIAIEEKGLVISQFSPALQIQRWFFPLRNGVMSGMSLATVIVEAGETSGSLKQADYAIKQNRLVIIPQSAMDNPRITWPQKYKEKGAKVANTSTDVIKVLENSDILRVKSSLRMIEEPDDESSLINNLTAPIIISIRDKGI